MKILHTVEFYWPSIGGAQEVVRQLSERLVELGHDVTVATTKLPERKEKVINGVKIVEFAISGNSVRGLEGEVEKYKDFLKNSKFDLVMNYAAQQWASDLFFDVIDEVKAKKVFVPCGFSGLYDPAYKAYFAKMPEILNKYDATVYLSNDYRDINFARRHHVKNTALIPNGAGEDEFLPAGRQGLIRSKIDIRAKLGIPDDHFLILHVGSHTGGKGHKEAIEIFKRARIKNATLLIVGNEFSGGCKYSCRLAALLSRISPRFFFERKNLIIANLPRKETVPAYKVADLFLFPSNLEASPLVLFESMAAKIPFLTADVGNSKEIVAWSGGGEVLPTAKDKLGYSRVEINKSARKLEELFHNAERREVLAKAGFAAWRRRFTWEKITKGYEKLYFELLRKI